MPADAAPNDESGIPPDAAAPSAAPTGDQPRKRRRRRRRRGPRAPGAPAPGAATAAPGTEGQTEPTPQQGAPPNEGAPASEPRFRGRGRGPRNFRSRDDRPREGGEPARERGGPNQGPRDRDTRNKGDRGPRDRGAPNKQRHGAGKRPFGKGRDEFRRKPEPKLYSFESVVDRGFEDVAEAPKPADEATQGAAEAAQDANETNQQAAEANQDVNETNQQATEAAQKATRRIEWTIVKRTVADQRAAKTVSAVYVLKRDGVDTDFANLALARAAVNKTIVHPEKLTRAKADYGSTKK